MRQSHLPSPSSLPDVLEHIYNRKPRRGEILVARRWQSAVPRQANHERAVNIFWRVFSDAHSRVGISVFAFSDYCVKLSGRIPREGLKRKGGIQPKG